MTPEELIPHADRECGEHRPTIGRSWCFEDKEWCYPDAPYRGCELPALRAEVAELRELANDAAILKSGQPWEELFRQRDEAIAERDRLRAHILDIDAHATPYGDIPDEPGYVGTYLLTAGALHRALGKVGHSAPSCEAEAERDRYVEVVEAARVWRAQFSRPKTHFPRMDALIAAVDRLTPGDTASPQSARDLATAYRQLITEHDRLMAHRAELILSGVDPGELLMPEVPLPPPGDGDG